MKKKTVVLEKNARFHSMPASKVAFAAQQFTAAICLAAGERMTDCKNVIALMNMAIPENRILEIIADGPDELEAVSEIEYIIKNMYWR